MKLIKHLFYDLSKAQQEEVLKIFSRFYNPEYLNDTYSHDLVNAEVVTDGDGTFYDMRVFDPFEKVHPRIDENFPDCPWLIDEDISIGPDGWSDWLFDYRDVESHGIDAIFEYYNGNATISLYEKYASYWGDYDDD